MRWLFFTMLLLTGWVNAASFVISYASGTPSVQIQQDMVAAAQNVAQFLVLTHDINIEVSFAILPGHILAESSPSAYCAHWNATYAPYMLVPAALYVQGTGAPNCPSATGTVHINMIINSVYLNQYNYCPQCRPDRASYDFVTMAMHEIIHGLGMGTGIDGSGINGNAPFCNVFDCFIFGNTTFGWPTSFESSVPSTISIPAILTSRALYFNGSVANSYFALYAPSVFVAGGSVSHTAFPNLMYYQLPRGVSWHVLNKNIVAMLETFGYNVVNCDNPDIRCGNCLLHYSCFTVYSSATSFSWLLDNIF